VIAHHGEIRATGDTHAMMASDLWYAHALITALFLNTRPKSSVSGKTSSCSGKNLRLNPRDKLWGF